MIASGIARRRAAAVTIVVGALAVSWAGRGTTISVPGWLVPIVLSFPLWLAGDAWVARRRCARSLRDRARLLDCERETAVRAAVEEERAASTWSPRRPPASRPCRPSGGLSRTWS